MDRIFSENNNISRRYVAFFDLDRTLTARISGKALTVQALKNGMMPPGWIASALKLFLLHKTGLRASEEIINRMAGWTRGKPESDIERLCKEVSRKILIPSLFPQARVEIESHKRNKGEVVILSSALNYICSEISEYLGMDGYVCSYLEVSNCTCTGNPSGNLCFGEEKLRMMKEYCIKNTMSLSDSWYYGDSLSDLPALLAAGTPVCVNPDRGLAREARQRNWKVLRWKS